MGHGEVDCKACHGFNGIISLLQQLIPVLTVNFFSLRLGRRRAADESWREEHPDHQRVSLS